ncbi:uncharacterized protein AMSG_00417 [Thecamonas trahens ATCC 50062]|uniref:Uncharacterized protein n=1 Tax=Thecamonas trahens ATCC 50062 TaxID=461836 RepID=A0A0L0D8T8_THETB|nr:hypothetical protein AMSG_00417 [Thecamonas trahens ATCC 50062]KNC48640.1 hypothetical protein AMSG_00417 [Thecamonas trahens ATCC 50062]|eukprot:XP_013762696.1 hypothetical protein AMSG_00417 [Thecamonas trahens ATCC 50062]
MSARRTESRRSAAASDEALWFGTRRASMKSNVLLNKDVTGQARSSTHALPAEDFRYGRPPKADERGVAKAMTWEADPPPVGVQAASPAKHRSPGRRGARPAPKGTTEPIPAAKFVPLASRRPDPVPKERVARTKVRNAIRAEDRRQASFGMADVLSNSGQAEYLAKHQQRERAKAERRRAAQAAAKLPGKSFRAAAAAEASARQGATKRAAASGTSRDLFKLSKFRNVPARTHSRRSAPAPASSS